MMNSIMAAASGMLKPKPTPFAQKLGEAQLKLQIPTIQVTAPIATPRYMLTAPIPSPQCVAGAELKEGEIEEGEINNDNGKRRGSGIEDPRAMNKPQVPKAIDSKTHFQGKYILLRPLSEGDNGETAAAISKADLVDVAARYGNDRSPAFFNALRAKMVAVKFAKPHSLEGDLTGEIQFFTEKFPYRHSSINGAIDSHLDGDCQWYTLPYASGGDLLGFLSKYPTDFGLSFRWHIAEHMASALLFLFFGIEDTANLPTKVPAWPLIVHHDIFSGNTLLDAPSPSDPTGYPSVIVSDFGRAQCYDDWLNCPEEDIDKNMFRFREDHQSKDINQLGNVLKEITQCYLEASNPCAHGEWASPHPTAGEHEFDNEEGVCTRCCAVVDGLDDPEGDEATFKMFMERLRHFEPEQANGADAYQLFCRVVQVAKKQKVKTFKPLSAEATGRLRTSCVSDENFRRVLGIYDRPKLMPKSRKR